MAFQVNNNGARFLTLGENLFQTCKSTPIIVKNIFKQARLRKFTSIQKYATKMRVENKKEEMQPAKMVDQTVENGRSKCGIQGKLPGAGLGNKENFSEWAPQRTFSRKRHLF